MRSLTGTRLLPEKYNESIKYFIVSRNPILIYNPFSKLTKTAKFGTISLASRLRLGDK